ncbi:glycoside hydrolase family 16 protein [Amanita thiersii Skay4041]|uniref:Glycoside hydrolase family 16 protein n=1 Tax=Amanita thiersii Skay4041 TaxID=703135 RepID=A0A2A9NGQ6_9AGAR|nr:glycoside hydrolase family 16 protein [Amanita thiersii Skay4041]
MSRPPSPTHDNPFDTPTSTRPPSERRLDISRPSTGTSSPSLYSASTGSSGILTVPRYGIQTAQQPTIRSILASRPDSAHSSTPRFPAISTTRPTTPSALAAKPKAPRMRSHLVNTDVPVPKPWNDKKNPRATFAYFLTYGVICIGLIGGILQSYFKYKNAELDRKPLCLVFEENFDDEDGVFGENGSFQREVNMDGFGNGEFSMTTESRNNSFVKDGFLYIVPTLTADNIGWDAIYDGTVYNITGCTFLDTQPNGGYVTQDGYRYFDQASYYRACSAISNRTLGTVINPVQSARITTRKSASIKFGRVEVRAKMPTGDWMWPAIWMLPRDNVYGTWPRSGEIDILESRGNGIRYTARGSNFVQGSLHWGPTPQLDGVTRTYSWWTDKRKSFGSDFHTYALEWTEDFLRIYVDSRLHTLLDIRFSKPFWDRGKFPDVLFDQNSANFIPLNNPWINGTKATPFDQEFYLIMNVAVGSTNGWFPNYQGDKPWIDDSSRPMADFARSYPKWYPSWPLDAKDRGMVVDYVKMWKHCDNK